MDQASDQSTDKAAPYRVLARKYRPADFTQLIGQEPMVRTLTNAFATGRIAQAWMLTGVRGVGKTTTARILARALNYKTDEVDKPSIDLSVPGEHCQAIMEGRHVDVIEMDAASHTGIDDIKQIIDGVRYSPVAARYKVYIIDEIHMLSDKAFNALLKTLEEPPPHAKFIFATTEIRKVPITVLSRCQRFDLRRIEPDEMTAHLKWVANEEKVEAEETALALIARAGEGSVRDALSIMDQAISHGSGTIDAAAVRSMLGLADRARIVDLFEHVMAGRVAEALAEFKDQYDAGADPAVVLTDLASFTHLVTRLRYVPGAAERDVSLSPDERERGLAFAGKLPVTVLARAWQMLLKGITEVEQAARPVAAAEMVLIRLGHAATLPTLDDALKKLETAPPAAVARQTGGEAAGSGSGSGGGTAMDAVSHDHAVRHEPSGQPVMSARNDGNAMRLVASEPEVRAESHTKEVPQTDVSREANPLPAINLPQDLADLAEANRDPMMRAKIRKFIRLVRVENGQLTIGVTEDAPATMAGELSGRMREWFGRPIMVVVTKEPGGLTLEAEDRRQRDELLADAGRDPAVSALLAAFPGAKIVDVRLGEAVVEDDILVEADLVDPDEVPADPDED